MLMCAGTPCLVIISRSDPPNSQPSDIFHSLHILAAEEEQAERITGLRLKWSLPGVMAACNIVLQKKELAVLLLMALVRRRRSQHSASRTGFYWSWAARQIAPQISRPFLCKLGELWPQQVVPQAGVSATGLEADGPPDATLTHRLALIADADH